MVIVIDGTTICDKDGGHGAGIEHYSWSIVFALLRLPSVHEFVLVLPSVLSEPRVRVLLEGVTRPVKLIRVGSNTVPFLSRHILLPLRLLLSRPSVYFSPFGQIPYFWKGTSVVTIHDVAIYEHPEWFADLGNQDFSVRVSVPRSIQSAQKIIAVSESTKQHLEQVFPSSGEKTIVVMEGVSSIAEPMHEYASDRFPFDKDFVLFLGTIEPRKNIETAIQAFHLFLVNHPELAQTVRFIIAGKQGWGADAVLRLANEVNAAWQEAEPEGVIRFLGTVTEEEKWSLLRKATTFLFPSLYEGFGLPILEAMSVGTVVITTDQGALAEVGADAVISVDPFDAQGMSLALAQCLLVPEGVQFLCEQAWLHTRKFTWEKTAEETVRVLEQAVRASKNIV